MTIASIPLNGRTIRKLGISDSLSDGDIRYFWTTMRHQEIVPALRQPDAYNLHDFGVGYTESAKRYTFTDLDYVSANQRWIETGEPHDETWTDEDWRLFLALQGNESIRALVQLVDDESFQPTLADFLTRSCQFAELTGESLDASKNNIIFYQDPGQSTWRYMLVDALFPSNSGNIDTTRYILDQLSNYSQSTRLLTRKEGLMLINTLGFVRSVNALSEYLHLPNRIALLPPKKTLLDTTWMNIAANLSDL